MGRFSKCKTCVMIYKVINEDALKVCVRKEQFPSGQIYFSIDKYLEDLLGDRF